MNNTIMAVYEKGVLKPLGELNLKEHEQVRIKIEPQGIEITPLFAQRVENFIEKYRPALEKLAKR
jgi:predicted DNA-binding antitoxin AbrB/MazE fold protein